MNKGEIQIYKASSGHTEIQVKLENETVWLSQADIQLLFGRDQSVISRHINNIFKEKELDKESTMQKMHIANSDKPVFFLQSGCNYISLIQSKIIRMNSV